jgi:hypothetical protein
MCCGSSYLKRGFCFFDGDEKTFLIQLSERLARLHDIVEIDENLSDSTGKLRAHIDRNFGIDRTGCFHQRRNCAAFYRCGKEGGSFAILIVGVTKPHAHRTQQKRCNCCAPHFHLRRWKSGIRFAATPQVCILAIFRPRDLGYPIA